MRRRDILKGAAVAAGASVVGLPTDAKGQQPNKADLARKVGSPLKVALEITPSGDPPVFAPCFQRRMEQWAEYWEGHFRPVGEFYFELREVEKALSKGGYAGARPWLMHPKWSEPPLGPTILRPGRWGIIDRAAYFRCYAYWKQEYGPQYTGLDGGGMSPGTSHFRMFRRIAGPKLHHIMVHFEAEGTWA